MQEFCDVYLSYTCSPFIPVLQCIVLLYHGGFLSGPRKRESRGFYFYRGISFCEIKKARRWHDTADVYYF